jgi:regulator of RNase E activity RraA
MDQDKNLNGYEVRKLVLSYDVKSIRERYLKLSAALLFDAMEQMGIRDSAMDSGIYPLERNMKVAGPAFTATRYQGPAATEHQDNTHIGLINSLTEGCVFISDSGGNMNSAHFGDITATCYRAAGCTGAVMDGSTRDANYLIEMGFPMFCRFRNPVEGCGRSILIDYMVPIFVKGVNGMLRINPGDFVFGDNDGVVIIPKDMTVPVLEHAEQLFDAEEKSRAAVANGVHPFEVYNIYKRF